MNDKQIIAMWTSNILQRYAEKTSIQSDGLPAFAAQNNLLKFLIENYELFHLYPDEAVFDEINKELQGIHYV
jgi:uncharacterized protein YdhG (YjbR/CyaY superfamily)